LTWLRGKQYDSSAELLGLQEEDEKQKATTVNLKAALSRPASVKAIVIGVGLMFFTQMCGINVVIFYTTDIFNVSFFEYLKFRKKNNLFYLTQRYFL
jgi:hypothetical protein